MNEDDAKLIENLELHGIGLTTKAANRLRELTGVEAPEMCYHTEDLPEKPVIPPCDAAGDVASRLRALREYHTDSATGMVAIGPMIKDKQFEDMAATLIQSALTAKAEEVRERCAAEIERIEHYLHTKILAVPELRQEQAKHLRALDLTEVGE